jgi:hypothetical protein
MAGPKVDVKQPVIEENGYQGRFRLGGNTSAAYSEKAR